MILLMVALLSTFEYSPQQFNSAVASTSETQFSARPIKKDGKCIFLLSLAYGLPGVMDAQMHKMSGVYLVMQVDGNDVVVSVPMVEIYDGVATFYVHSPVTHQQMKTGDLLHIEVVTRGKLAMGVSYPLDGYLVATGHALRACQASSY